MKNKYKYQDIAEYLEANGQKEAADQLRAGFAERERGVCQKDARFPKGKVEPPDYIHKNRTNVVVLLGDGDVL